MRVRGRVGTVVRLDPMSLWISSQVPAEHGPVSKRRERAGSPRACMCWHGWNQMDAGLPLAAVRGARPCFLSSPLPSLPVFWLLELYLDSSLPERLPSLSRRLISQGFPACRDRRAQAYTWKETYAPLKRRVKGWRACTHPPASSRSPSPSWAQRGIGPQMLAWGSCALGQGRPGHHARWRHFPIRRSVV